MAVRKGLTLTDILVLIVIVVIVLLVVPPLIMPHNWQNPRLVCGTSLMGLGTAMNTYAFDYDDKFPVVGGVNAPWAKRLGWRYDATNVDYSEGGEQEHAGRTITANWFLLVREADVDPASFICDDSGLKVFEKDKDQKFYEMWDFGDEPYNHVSYAMQMPFGKFPAKKTTHAGNAVAGDMSPWFNNGDIVLPDTIDGGPNLVRVEFATTHKRGNSINHNGEGQNVLYGDGHVEFNKTSNVGHEKDNIYTYWSATDNPTEQDRQGGSNPVERSKETDSKAAADSFLAI
ncbi:MAG: hypothetical protein KAS23_06395 [Anaerohalosphaera sp.]|nr:hypothetical protein [Anaerohalosphaera sp.]